MIRREYRVYQRLEGVQGVPRVDKIVGPGNLFVALAKKLVFGR